MTDIEKQEYEKVRAECQLTPEEIIKAYWGKYVGTADVNNAIANTATDKVLRHPSILIKHPNQELPEIVDGEYEHRKDEQTRMLESGYVRVLEDKDA